MSIDRRVDKKRCGTYAQYKLERLELELQYFGHRTHWKRPWCWEGLRAGGEGDNRRWDSWMASLTQWRWVWVNPELVMDWEAWRNAVHGVTKSRTRLSDWTQLTDKLGVLYLPYYTITNSGLVITPISQIGKLRFHNLFFVTQLSSEISGFRSCFIWL